VSPLCIHSDTQPLAPDNPMVWVSKTRDAWQE
jgi:hypothetical protein